MVAETAIRSLRRLGYQIALGKTALYSSLWSLLEAADDAGISELHVETETPYEGGPLPAIVWLVTSDGARFAMAVYYLPFAKLTYHPQ